MQGGISRTFSYSDPVHPDRKNFIMSETNPESGTITYGRDEVGNMTKKTDSSGTKYYIYDSLNRLKCISLIDNDVACSGTAIKYDYDNANNRISLISPSASITFHYDEVNRQYQKDESIGGRSYTTKFDYNDNDYLESITYPTTLRVVTYGYNTKNETTYVTGFGGNVSSVSNPIRYNTAGLPTDFFYSNEISSAIHYNGRNLADSITSGSAVDIGYDFDSRGNTEAITDYLDSTKSQSFLYDDLSRITTFNGAWGNGLFEYYPDGLGNRWKKTVAGATTTYFYTNNRMSSSTDAEPASYDYYDNGALSGGSSRAGGYTLVYDDFLNLASYKLGTTSLADFSYDGDGMRVTKTVGAAKTVYHYDQAGRVLSEDDGNGNNIADYIYLNGKLVAKVSTEPNISSLLTVNKNGSGLVTSTPSAINCSATCSAYFTTGTSVTLQAVPDFNSSFAGWSGGGCSGTGTCTVTLNDDVSVTATFNLLPPVAAFSAAPTSGNVPLAVAFTDQSQLASTWEWTFGDGSTSFLQNPTYTYTTPGTYSVRLLVRNAEGWSHQVTKDNLIYVAPLVQIPRIPPAYFPTLQAASDAAQDGETIQSQSLVFTGDLVANQPVTIFLDGGYSNDFSTATGLTIIKGTVVIRNGTVIPAKVVVRPITDPPESPEPPLDPTEYPPPHAVSAEEGI